MLLTIAILNLVFSLFCGCVSGFWAKGWYAMHAHPDEVVQDVDQLRETIRWQFESGLDHGDRKLDEKQLAAIKTFTDSITEPEAIQAALTAIGDSPAAGLIRTTTLVAAIAQAVLFIGSILLLTRKNAGRILSMLAFVAFIAASVTTFVKLPPVVHDASEAYTTKLSSGPAFQALQQKDQEEAHRAIDKVPLLAERAVQGFSIFSIVWPAVSLLILFASRGIREDCLRGRGLP